MNRMEAQARRDASPRFRAGAVSLKNGLARVAGLSLRSPDDA
jgi:hypothetical protein